MRRIIFLVASFLSSFALAQDELPFPIKLGGSEITFERGEDDEITVTYAGKEIYRNYYVSAGQTVLVEGVEVALISSGDGGNACGPATLIVMVPEGAVDASLEIVGEECGSPTPAVNANEVLFVPYLLPGAKAQVQRWAPSTGLIAVGEISYIPKPDSNWANFDPQRADSPYDLFENADIYSATRSLVGPKFDELVLLLGVSSAPELIAENYVAAAGCQAHACGVANGFLGIDMGLRAVYAATRYSDQPETFWPKDIKSWPQPLQTAYEASKQQ